MFFPQGPLKYVEAWLQAGKPMNRIAMVLEKGEPSDE